MEVNLGGKIQPKKGDESNEDGKDVDAEKPSPVILKILAGKAKELDDSDMDDIHNHWHKCRRKWLNVRESI